MPGEPDHTVLAPNKLLTLNHTLVRTCHSATVPKRRLLCIKTDATWLKHYGAGVLHKSNCNLPDQAIPP